MLNCIDVFTKCAWSMPLRTKTGREVSDAFERIVSEQRCNIMQSDKGTKFLNPIFQSFYDVMALNFTPAKTKILKPP